MRVNKINVVVVALISAVSSVAAHASSKLVTDAKKAVRAVLKDPESARFEIKYADGGNVCGTVNAKNSYGGYAGAVRFLYQSEGNTILIMSDHPEVASPGKISSDEFANLLVPMLCDAMEKEGRRASKEAVSVKGASSASKAR